MPEITQVPQEPTLNPPITPDPPITPEIPPKRKPGRPRKEQTGSLENDGVGEREPKRRTGDLKIIRDALNQQIAGLALMITFVDQFDGIIIADRGPVVVEQLVTVAEHNPKFRAALLAFTRNSAYAGLVMACVSLITPIMAHHGFLPEMMLLGVPDAAFDAHNASKGKKVPNFKTNGSIVTPDTFRPDN